MKKIFVLLIFTIVAIAAYFFYRLSPSENQIVSQPAKQLPDLTSNQDMLDLEDIPPKEPEPGSEGRAFYEKKLGGFSEEEVALKPQEASWYQWAYSVGTHRSSLAKNGKVEFFGRITDEDGSGLAGVTLEIELEYDEPSLKETLRTGDSARIQTFEITTGSNGDFTFNDQKGRGIIIQKLSKTGYENSDKKNYWSFSFNPSSSVLHKPDPTKPVEFVMAKSE